jgi:hypothetical protein
VDLLGIMKMVGHAREVVNLVRGEPQPDWASDEEAFHRHFGVSSEAYAEIVGHLQPEQTELLRRTLEVNPEAAVLWVLSMEEVA